MVPTWERALAATILAQAQVRASKISNVYLYVSGALLIVQSRTKAMTGILEKMEAGVRILSASQMLHKHSFL